MFKKKVAAKEVSEATVKDSTTVGRSRELKELRASIAFRDGKLEWVTVSKFQRFNYGTLSLNSIEEIATLVELLKWVEQSISNPPKAGE